MTDKPNNLYEAISYVQERAGKIEKKSINPYFNSRYADLGTIHEAIKPVMREAGLVFTHFTRFHADVPAESVVTCLVFGDKDDKLISETLIPPNLDAQKRGSYLTYMRRYHECLMLDLVANDDDDGAGASKRPEPPPNNVVDAVPKIREMAAKEASKKFDDKMFEIYEGIAAIIGQDKAKERLVAVTKKYGADTYRGIAEEDRDNYVADCVKLRMKVEAEAKDGK